MKITKKQLRKIIREEKARMLECGEDMDMDMGMDIGMHHDSGEHAVVSKAAPVVESNSPEHDVLVEMVMASRALDQVVESVQNAAHICHDCVDNVAAQAPIVEAVVAQAEALQEMITAQVEVIQENADASGHDVVVGMAPPSPGHETPIVDAVIDVVEELA